MCSPRGDDGAPWHKYYSNGWSDRQKLGGYILPGTDPAAVSWASNPIDVFYRKTDDTLGRTTWNSGLGWGYPSGATLGGILTSDPAVSSWGVGRLDVFVRATDNAIWHQRWDGASWAP